ncbi:exopolysaccharide production protein ExoQ 2 (plasmid) [Rhizobium etli 8C-3]|uniref:Exopolysaccharide production protein ExoQ n=2 Tax=Rhizobium TaxID=379 RepID=A0A4R3RUT2_9HYPH|nr:MULTISPECIES: O-antigen ligase [Rhizobium]APO78615.1 exopolysaccharide production protein ExoQ 2 [Rhizobium etli 8C-3]TCU24593.1 exopolysaccharide production protein ExoQ [Rhizobium azibense]TCU39341.1 exopolysaccharide production protein ExoQ [Rhizobium azibense]
MRISINAFLSPGQNAPFAISAMIATMFFIAYAQLFGSVFILLFYLVWLPLLAMDPRAVIGDPRPFYWIFAFSIFACLSFFWSAVPGLSLRGGLQYLSTIACALIAARVVPVKAMVLGMSLGASLVLLYSLMFGHFSYDPLDGVYSFIGAFASKNQLGMFAALGVFASFSLVFILRVQMIWRILALMSGVFGAFSLHAAQSATSTITIAATIAVAVAAVFLKRFSPRHRTVLFLSIVPAAAVGLLIALSSGLFGAILGVFGKDATLTGRTYLWQRGIEIAHDEPIFGLGFQGFWVQGFSQPEVLWQQFYIASRAGFHFHNTYIEAAVELGYIGLVLLGAVILGLLVGYIRRLLSSGARDEDVILFGIVILFIGRSFFEVDFLNQYTIGTFLIYYCAGALAKPVAGTASSASVRYYSQFAGKEGFHVPRRGGHA